MATEHMTIGEMWAKRDRLIEDILKEFRAECACQDAAHDALYDAARDRYATEMQRLKAMPKPDHKAATERRDKRLAEVDEQLQKEMQNGKTLED